MKKFKERFIDAALYILAGVVCVAMGFVSFGLQYHRPEIVTPATVVAFTALCILVILPCLDN